MMTRNSWTFIIGSLMVCTSAGGNPPMPNEYESPGDELNPLFAYFGGVSTWGSNLSPTTIHSGGSLEIWANLQPDWASFSGFGLGTFGIDAPLLGIDPAADTFSLTIKAPTNGQLSFYVVIREDDNGDGVLDINIADDQWETATVMLASGLQVYNFSFSDFIDIDIGAGNNIQNFTTTNRLAYFLVFETHDSYPGGHIIEPISFLIDHVGFYVGPQQIPNNCPASVNADGVVNVTDLLALLAAWGVCVQCSEDINQDGLVNVTDLLTLLAAWGACP